jgi:hypothetical protein
MIQSIQAKLFVCDVCGAKRLVSESEPIPYRCAARGCQSALWNGPRERVKRVRVVKEPIPHVPLSEKLSEAPVQEEEAIILEERVKIDTVVAAPKKTRAERKFSRARPAKKEKRGETVSGDMKEIISRTVSRKTGHSLGCPCFECVSLATMMAPKQAKKK